jgi:hypothetical protein
VYWRVRKKQKKRERGKWYRHVFMYERPIEGRGGTRKLLRNRKSLERVYKL